MLSNDTIDALPPPPPHIHTHTHTLTHTLTLFKCLFEQQGLQTGVQLLPDVLDQDGGAKLDAVLQCAHVVWVGELYYLQVAPPLRVLHPLVGLALRVDHQRPGCGEVVGGGRGGGCGEVGMNVRESVRNISIPETERSPETEVCSHAKTGTFWKPFYSNYGTFCSTPVL